MTTHDDIQAYISSQPEPKRGDLLALHDAVLGLMPSARLWFLDGRNDQGKVVSNPNIGYGEHEIAYADGSTKPFYRIGLSANTAGISVYLFGFADKEHLARTFGATLGKATISGYCIKFKRLKDIQVEVLVAAMRAAIDQPA